MTRSFDRSFFNNLKLQSTVFCSFRKLNLDTKSGALTICTEISVKNFRQISLVFFCGTENRNGIELYHLQNTAKFFAFSRLGAWHWQSKLNGTGDFGPFGKNGKKVIPRKALLFSRKNFHRDEPLHMNSFRNFRVFHTNSKRSTISQFGMTVAKHHVTVKRDLTDRRSSFQDVSVKFYPNLL